MNGAIATGLVSGTALEFAETARAEESVLADETLAYANPDQIGIIQKTDVEQTVDLVVVGSGIGGLTAAMVTAEQAPDAKIILVEKLGITGGNGNYAEICAPASPVTHEEARQTALDTVVQSNYLKDIYLLESMAYDGALNSEWLLVKHGVKLDNSYFYYEGWRGDRAMAQLTDQIETDPAYANVEIRLNCRATALLMDDPYTCTGVQVLSDGKYIDIKAKGVFLATGGMATNFDLLRFFTNQDIREKSFGIGAGQDGDGHLMVQQTAHGMCKSVYPTSMFHNVPGFAFESPLGVAAVMQPTGLFVNQNGDRYADESAINVYPFMDAGKAIETNGKCFSIMGQNLIQEFENNGSRTEWWYYYGVPTSLQDDLAKYADNEYVFSGETIAELAVAMGINPDALQKTVDTYEVDAAAGTGDTLFGKPSGFMLSLGEGPYYGFRMFSGVIQTNGGIRVDRFCRVCDPYFAPVTGLYAGGIAISGLNVEVYTPGTSQAAGLWSGSVVARHFVENVLGQPVVEDWFGPEPYPGPYMNRAAAGLNKPILDY